MFMASSGAPVHICDPLSLSLYTTFIDSRAVIKSLLITIVSRTCLQKSSLLYRHDVPTDCHFELYRGTKFVQNLEKNIDLVL